MINAKLMSIVEDRATQSQMLLAHMTLARTAQRTPPHQLCFCVTWPLFGTHFNGSRIVACLTVLEIT
jgi:hypothetical protein